MTSANGNDNDSHNDSSSNHSIVLSDYFLEYPKTTRSGIIDQIIYDDENDNHTTTTSTPSHPQHHPQGICRIAFMTPITGLIAGQRRRVPWIEHIPLSSYTAMTMAIHMLNHGDGSVIREIEHLDQWCPLKFTLEAVDTGANPPHAAQLTTELMGRQSSQGSSSSTTDSDNTTHNSSDNNHHEICAVLGGQPSYESIPMALLTGLAGRPQISHWSESSQLDNKESFPLFGRLVTSELGSVVPLLLYLKQQNVHHLGLLHWNEDYGNAFARSLLQQATLYHPTLVMVAADIPSTDATAEDYDQAVAVLQKTQYRWFFCVYGPVNDYIPVMERAVQAGIAGTGQHVWLLNNRASDAFLSSAMLYHSNNLSSALAKATRGVGTFAPLNGRAGMPVFDRFVEQFRALHHNSSYSTKNVDYLNAHLPTYENEQPEGFQGPQVGPQTFEQDLAFQASTVFDCTIALALGACRAAVASRDSSNSDSDNPPVITVTGPAMYQQILNGTFAGTTGQVELEPNTGSRVPTSALFRINNAVPVPINETHIGYEMVESSVFLNGAWRQEEPFVYNDGTTRVPSDLPDAQMNYNYIGRALRGTGMTMASLVLATSLFFAGWTLFRRDVHVVKASQPIFLLLLCVGTFVMGSTIIFLGIDDDIASTNVCDKACMAAPWLASIGFSICFASLYSKMYRINRLFRHTSMRKITLTARDVMAPMTILLLFNIALLAAWTAVSPLEWEREITSRDVFNQPTESRGYCTSDDFLPFVIPLVAVNIGALLLASHQSYLARRVSTEFAESEYLAAATTIMLLVSFIGVPTMILVSEEPRARYFVMTSVIFIITMAVLLFIFVPKMMAASKDAKAIKRAIRQTMHRHRHDQRQTPSSSSQLPEESRKRYVNSDLPSSRSQNFGGEDDDAQKDADGHDGNTAEPSSSDGSGEGIKILNNPEEMMAMKQEIQQLRQRNQSLEEELQSLLKQSSSKGNNNTDAGALDSAEKQD